MGAHDTVDRQPRINEAKHLLASDTGLEQPLAQRVRREVLWCTEEEHARGVALPHLQDRLNDGDRFAGPRGAKDGYRGPAAREGGHGGNC